jgi:hypothetical protein
VRSAAALALAVAAGIGCGDSGDPCAGHDTCIAVEVESATVEQIDQLELDVLYGGIHGTSSTQPAGGGVTGLPLVTAIDLDISATKPFGVGVVAAGKLSGVVLGTGAATLTLEPGAHGSIALVLAVPDNCVAGAFYCGGDKLSGDPDTLYQCNGGGVPLARGVCITGCAVRPTLDDTCHGEGVCTEGGLYCGGNVIDGDPQILYRCMNGVGTNPRVCPNRCVIQAGGLADVCQ